MKALGVTVAAALALAGCGEEDESFPTACDDSVAAVQEALERAPGDVALSEGTKLSTCIDRSRTSADIQTVGALYTATADALSMQAPRSDAAALRLGYLLGATRRGAARTNGIHEELVRRLQNTAGTPIAGRAAFRRGEAAGLRSG